MEKTFPLSALIAAAETQRHRDVPRYEASLTSGNPGNVAEFLRPEVPSSSDSADLFANLNPTLTRPKEPGGSPEDPSQQQSSWRLCEEAKVMKSHR